jgi:hypothetical protein
MRLKADKSDRIFIGIIVLAHLICFLLARYYTRIYMGDSFEYIYEALNIESNGFFYSGNPALPIEVEYMTQRQPLYPFFLLVVYMFSINNWIVIILQNLISICNIYYARRILLRLGYQKKYDWLRLLMIVAYPSQFINANTIAPDILLQTFTLLYFGNLIEYVQTRQQRHLLWMSIALACGMLVKPVLYPFVIVHVVMVLAIVLVRRQQVSKAIAVALIPIVTMMLYSYWNYTRTGKYHFSSNQSFNAIFYYYSYFNNKEGTKKATEFLDSERGKIAAIPEYKERYDYANARGITLLKENFAPYMAFHLKNSARIFIEPGKAEMDLFTGRLTYGRLYSREQTGFFATLKSKGWSGVGAYIRSNPSMPLVFIVLLFNLVRVVGLVLFFASAAVPRGIRILSFIFISYFAVAAGPIANTRYFLPVSLLAIGCSCTGLILFFQKKKNLQDGRLQTKAA